MRLGSFGIFLKLSLRVFLTVYFDGNYENCHNFNVLIRIQVQIQAYFCIIIESGKPIKRLKKFERTTDGFANYLSWHQDQTFNQSSWAQRNFFRIFSCRRDSQRSQRPFRWHKNGNLNPGNSNILFFARRRRRCKKKTRTLCLKMPQKLTKRWGKVSKITDFYLKIL